MFEQVLRFISKVEDKSSEWIVENGTSIEIAERMLLQFLQHLGQLKAQQAAIQEAQKAAEEKSKIEPISEEPKQE